MAVNRVGIKEFRDKATQLLAKDEPFLVERHGRVIGYYTPLARKDPEARRRAFEQLDATMRRAAREAGMTLEEFEDLLTGDLL